MARKTSIGMEVMGFCGKPSDEWFAALAAAAARVPGPGEDFPEDAPELSGLHEAPGMDHVSMGP